MERNVTGIAQQRGRRATDNGLVLKSPGEANVNKCRMLVSSEYLDEDGTQPTLTITTSGPSSELTVTAPAITPAKTVDGTTENSSRTPQLALSGRLTIVTTTCAEGC
ncbi:hypothetical protein [Nonomuraea sp. KM88]|uniref:hypothetical protein n=1 Tax=Nonomuraea sp. KM88 TaxID=3457427 RepID=UPI003FCC895C